MKVGVGYGNNENPFSLARAIAEKALESGDIKRPDLVFAFCAGGIDHGMFFTGLQSIVGKEVPIVGGSAIGVITNHDLSYKNSPAAAAILQSDDIRLRIACSGRLNQGEEKAGRLLMKKLESKPEDRLMMLFYDSVRVPATKTSPPVLNTSSGLLIGIEKDLRPGMPLIGAGLVGDYNFGSTRQFCGSFAADQHVLGLVLSGNVRVYHRIMHGCTPLDGIYHRITSLKEDTIYELDGQPIIEMIDYIYEGRDWQDQHPLRYLTIGVNLGERYGEPQEDQYINRLITGITPDGKGIALFEEDLQAGMEVQFMLRDMELMFHSVAKNCEELIAEILKDGLKPVFAMYIDCAGRTAEYSNTLREEASEVQNILNRHEVPLLGFYSGVEIAPLRGKSRGLDWTGVITILAEGE